MIKKKVIGLLVVAMVALVVIAVVVFWPSAPEIPADHQGRTTCLGCHETGVNGAPAVPQGHLDKIARGSLTDNVTDCLECHEFADIE